MRGGLGRTLLAELPTMKRRSPLAFPPHGRQIGRNGPRERTQGQEVDVAVTLGGRSSATQGGADSMDMVRVRRAGSRAP